MSLLERTILNSGMCRKPQAKLEKACIPLRSLRRMFSEEKPEKHQTTSNRKPENPMLFLTKAKNRERNRIETAIVIKTEKRKFRSTKPKNRSTTLAENRKFQCTPPVMISCVQNHLQISLSRYCYASLATFFNE